MSDRKRVNNVDTAPPSYVSRRLRVFIYSTLVLLLLIMARQVAKQSDSDTESPTVSELEAMINSRPQPRGLYRLPEEQTEFEIETVMQELISGLKDLLQKYPTDQNLKHFAAATGTELLQEKWSLELYKDLSGSAPNNIDVAIDYARLLLKIGKQDEAIRVLKQCVASSAETPELLSVLGDAFSQMGQADKAVEVLEKAISLQSEHPQLLVQLAQSQVELKQFAAAERSVRSALTQGWDDPACYLVLSAALIGQGKRKEAFEVRKLLKTDVADETPYDQLRQDTFRQFASSTFTKLALNQITHGDAPSAERTLLRSLELNPKNSQSAGYLVDLLRRLGRLPDAIVVQQRLADLEPDNQLHTQNLASLAFEVNDLQLADRALQKLAELDQSGQSHLMLARLQTERRAWNDACKNAAVAAERLNQAEAYLIWINALKGAGKRGEASETTRRAKLLFPGDARMKNLK